MILKVERADLWKTLQSVAGFHAIIYTMVLAEDVAATTTEEREELARKIESRLMSAPLLEYYGRVGMYAFIGVTSERLEGVLRWCRQFNDFRCGVALAGADGLASAEKLMIGTAECSRQNRGEHAFYLADDWVVPAASRQPA